MGTSPSIAQLMAGPRAEGRVGACRAKGRRKRRPRISNALSFSRGRTRELMRWIASGERRPGGSRGPTRLTPFFLGIHMSRQKPS